MWTHLQHTSSQCRAANEVWGQWRRPKVHAKCPQAFRAEQASFPDLLQWRSEEATAENIQAMLPAQELTSEDQPPLKLTFGGGGIFFWWELGTIIWLSEQFDLGKVRMAGASSGALAAILAACKVDPYKALDVAHRLGQEYQIYERPLGLLGVWGKIIRLWLDELLPENAAELCRGRVEVVVTTLPFLQLDTISDYQSRDELIDAALASSHVPFVLDGKLATSIRGQSCFDGSFYDFLNCNNSCYLTCDGKAVLFDYFQDEDLQFERLDFLSLKDYNEVVRLMKMGYSYAQRCYDNGAFDEFDTSNCSRRGKFLLSSIRRLFQGGNISVFRNQTVVN